MSSNRGDCLCLDRSVREDEGKKIFDAETRSLGEEMPRQWARTTNGILAEQSQRVCRGDNASDTEGSEKTKPVRCNAMMLENT